MDVRTGTVEPGLVSLVRLMPQARGTLQVVYATALALMLVVAFLVWRPGVVSGGARSGAPPAPIPSWEQLMGRSVQARKAGAIPEAEQLLQQAAALSASFDARDIRRAHTRLGFAEFYLWSDRPQLAEQAYLEAVAIGEAAAGPHHPETVSLLEGLANFYYYRNRYDEAAPIFMRILEIARTSHPHEPLEEARRLRNLARLEQLRNRHAEATSMFHEALRLVEATAQRSPSELAEYVQATAESYLAWQKPELARPLAERALHLAERLSGPDALDVVPYLRTLADAYLATDEPRAAMRIYERAIGILARISGPDHSDLDPFRSGVRAALDRLGTVDPATSVAPSGRRS